MDKAGKTVGSVVTAKETGTVAAALGEPGRGATGSERVLAAIWRHMDGKPLDGGAYEDAFACIRNIGTERGTVALSEAHELRRRMSRASAAAMAAKDYAVMERLYDVNRRCLFYTAPVWFEDYLLAVEYNREKDKKFYVPRRKQLSPLVSAMQDLSERKLELLAISLPPGVGKSTLALFFLTWLAGKNPEKPILSGSHANSFLRGAYDECNRIFDPEGEYLWRDIFPQLHVIRTNAQDMLIDVGRDKRDAKRFPTLEFSSIGSGNAGKVRAENLLYCDDLVDGLEAALSRERMDKLYQLYATDLRQRKIGDAAELHIATRWSCHDVIGRLEQLYDGNNKARFIVVPALNEREESNFDYPIEAGFTTKFYLEQREAMDDASWRALYMNQPIEREGLLCSEDELRRYFELPDGEPDAIISVCDTKDKGADYCVMPIAYQYGQDYYIEGVVCDNSNPEVVEARLVTALMAHNVQMSRFESNSAGGKVAEKVQGEVKSKGGRTKITTKYTTANKATKIIVNSPWWKEHCLFRDDSVTKSDKEYRKFLQFLCSYTMAGRNKHDDVPDAMAMLAEYAQSFSGSVAKVTHSPIR